MENPKTDEKNRVKVIGGFKITDGTLFKFKEGYLKKTKNGEYQGIEFKSVEVNGISYTFFGNFLKEAKFEYGAYSEIIGILAKYNNGRKIATKELAFYKYEVD